MTLPAGLALALGSSAALNWGFFAQHGAASTLPPLSPRHPWRSLVALFSSSRWRIGFVTGLGGWALYVAALALAPLSLVQATSAGGIGLLALLVWRSGARLSGRELAGVGLAVGGLVLLGLSLAGAHTAHGRGSANAVALWLAASAVVSALAVAPRGGAGFGSAAGILYAAGDVATKSAVGGGALLLAFAAAVLAFHGLAFVALQLGFQRGSALATAGVATLFTNALPIAAGTTIFHEHLPAGLAGAVRVIAFAAVVLGAMALARPAGLGPPRTAKARRARVGRRVLLAAVPVAIAAFVAVRAAEARPAPLVHVWTIHYRAHDGLPRAAYVALPGWYGPRDDPPIPLVISPHGRGMGPIDNLANWGTLPALGRFAVVTPDGQGRELELYSWGDPGEVDDLARMPRFATQALPWLRIDRQRVYAIGGSMGGQETLLLVARHPQLLAGAAAFDAPTNMLLRYRDFLLLPDGRVLRRLARIEIGGTPSTDATAYRLRSPLDFARRIAFSGVPLQLWWSRRDRTVVDQAQQTGLLYRKIRQDNPDAPVRQFVGYWAHTAEMRATTRLPIALGFFHLLPPSLARFGGGRPLRPPAVTYIVSRGPARWCRAECPRWGR